MGSVPITVVEPKKYFIAPTANSGAWTADGNKIKWTTTVWLSIRDQFGATLTSAFQGAHVQESVKNPGQNYGAWVGLDQTAPTNYSPLGAHGNVNDVLLGGFPLPTAQLAQQIEQGTLIYPKNFVGVADPHVMGPFLMKFRVDQTELQGVTERNR